MKKHILPGVTLLSGALLALFTLVSNGGYLLVKYKTWLLLDLLLNLAQAVLILLLACLARAFYAKSGELLAWLKRLQIAAYAYCTCYLVNKLYSALSHGFDVFYGSPWAMSAALFLFALKLFTTIGACLIALDLLSEYMELKAESSLTV